MTILLSSCQHRRVTSTTGTPDGTVTFKDGAATLGTGSLSGGIATYETSSLSASSHTIVAAYGGSSGFNPSTSAEVTQAVQDPYGNKTFLPIAVKQANGW